jgi:hypothetical protein
VGKLSAESLHALNGRFLKDNLDLYQAEIARYRDNDAVVGIAMHGLVDSIFHSYDDGNGIVSYKAPIGHGLHGSEPDYMTEAKAQTATTQLIAAFETVADRTLSSDQRAQVFAALDNVLTRARSVTNDGIETHQRHEETYGYALPGKAPDAKIDMEMNFRDVVAATLGGNMKILSPAADLPSPFTRPMISRETSIGETQHYLGGGRDEAEAFYSRGMNAANTIIKDFVGQTPGYEPYRGRDFSEEKFYDSKNWNIRKWDIRNILPGYQPTPPRKSVGT